MGSDLEGSIRETGMLLYNLMEGESSSIFRKEYWTGKLFEWCMRNESFKVQAFRFIDVFPYLKHSKSVMRHLREYFSDPAVNSPPALGKSIQFASPSWIASKVIAAGIARNIRKIARQFIIGSSPADSLPGLKRLRARGMAFTIDLLGEAVVSEGEAEDYFRRYLDLIDSLSDALEKWPSLGTSSGKLDWGHSPKLNISLKTSAMYSQMNPCAFQYSIDKALERLRPILRKAVQTGTFLCLDMEHYAIKNLTLALYRRLMEEPEFRGYPHTGIVLQAYLRDCEADVNAMVAWAAKGGHHFTIRLVKGAYWDQETIHAGQNNWPIPVFSEKHQTDANFEHLARVILENREHIKLACASHNIRSIAAVAETAKEIGATDEDYEFQVLYGMGEPVRTALRKAGLYVRLYCPIGEMVQGMSYLVRRLLENTANESFLRQSFSQKVPVEQLLRNPADRLTDLQSPQSADLRTDKDPKPGPFRNEPPFDWSREDHRTNFEDALARIRAAFPIPVSLQIGGQAVSTKSVFQSSNPNKPQEIVGIVSLAGSREAEKAVLAAKSAFPAWRDTAPAVRAEYLFKAAESARNMRYQLAAFQVFEVGKSWSEADGDVCEAIDFLEYYAREMIRYGRPVNMSHVPGETSELTYEPRGVSVVIAPWNFPLAISTGMCSAAIVTGNTVVYKPASQSPVTASMLAQIFEEARLPKGVFNFLPGPGGELGDYLTGHPDVSLIAFTGSRDVGLRIIEKAYKTAPGATSVKNVIAEMGGKNAIIVDSDADLDEAILYILQSAFGYQGQKCSACSRLIVVEENFDRLMERLEAAAQSLNIGPTEYPQNFMGAVIEPAARDKILKYIELGKEEGSVLIERAVEHESGHFVPLVILTDLQQESRLAQDEIFGPVLSVIKVKDFEEALSVANGTEYALTGGVLSRSPGNISKARKNFRTGNLYINRGCTGAIVGRHPFGGFKMSGLGSKAGGPDYLLHFMVPTNIVENTVRRGFAPPDSFGTESAG
jgi:RHH-type proline utilization regulon transcriptional repressor/proline dehydrogenase/delta 1-pyrroline-5-carboxylate dehydrogenase